MIRPFRESDENEVVDLWRLTFPDDPPWNEPALIIQRKLAVQRELFLVCETDGHIVATVLAGFDGVRGWVYHLATMPQFRRRGIGRAMMLEVEKKLEALGCPKVNLQVRTTNANVIRFYQDLGYAIEDRVSLGKRLR